MKIQLLITAGLLAAAAPSAAAIFTFSKATGALTNSASLDATTGGRTIRATGVTYTVAPTSLTNTSQFTGTAAVGQSSSLTAGGVSVNSEDSVNGFPAGVGGNFPGQMDTTGAINEALSFALVNAGLGSIRINSVFLSAVSNADTLRVYTPGTAGALNLVGFGGTIAAPVGATATLLGGSGGNQRYRVDFAPFTTPGDIFYFTSRNDTNDGYRVVAIDATIVPEPATWALLIVGFGMVGVTARRRKSAIAA